MLSDLWRSGHWAGPWVRDHDFAAWELDVLWGSLHQISIFINPSVGEISLEIAAVLVLDVELSSWHAVAACSQPCLPESNGRKICRESVAPDDREIS